MANIIETIQNMLNGEYAGKIIPTFSYYEWDYFMCDERINPTFNCSKDNLEYAISLVQGIAIARFHTDEQRKFYAIESVQIPEPPITLPFDELPQEDDYEDEQPQLGDLTRFTDFSQDAPEYEIGDLYFNTPCGLTYQVIEKELTTRKFGYDTFSYTAKLIAIDETNDAE